MARPLEQAAIEQLFLSARSANRWQKRDLTREQVEELYGLMRMGPTSANCSPGRFRFLLSHEAREQLAPALSSGNLEKTLSASLSVVVAQHGLSYSPLLGQFPGCFKLLSALAGRFRSG